MEAMLAFADACTDSEGAVLGRGWQGILCCLFLLSSLAGKFPLPTCLKKGPFLS